MKKPTSSSSLHGLVGQSAQVLRRLSALPNPRKQIVDASQTPTAHHAVEWTSLRLPPWSADLHRRLEHVPICVEQGIPAAGSGMDPFSVTCSSCDGRRGRGCDGQQFPTSHSATTSLNCRSPRSSPKPTMRGRWCSRCRTNGATRHPAAAAALRARPVPDVARPQRPHRFGGALLLVVQLAVHRRRAHRHGQANRGRLRVQLAVRPRPRRHADPRAGPVGHLRAQDARRRLPAAGRRQRDHPDHVDLQVGALRRQRAGDAALRQPRRTLGDLRRRAARAGRQVSRPAHRGALAGIAAGTAAARRRWRSWPPRSPTGPRSSAGPARSWRRRARPWKR